MTKTILITGSTDGIGFETAKALASLGHKILIHGRCESKLTKTQTILSKLTSSETIESFRADLSKIQDVETLATAIADTHSKLDVLINNAGVFKVPTPFTKEGYDLRFIVNTIAPYLLTKRLLPLMSTDARVINLSSAAQSAVNPDALTGKVQLDDNQAYAQSKLALTMWSSHLAQALTNKEPAIIAINPASFLASKMVKDAYGVDGNDLRVGADILIKASLSDQFADASGKYFDNDQRQFALPHPDAQNNRKIEQVMQAIETALLKMSA